MNDRKPIMQPLHFPMPTEPARMPQGPGVQTDGTFEGGWRRVVVPDRGNVKIFTTTKRWRGIDVYIAKPTFDAAGANPLLRFKIYAVIDGMDRALVATGIYKHNAPGAGAIIYPTSWIAAARCGAARFEVEMSCNATPTNSGTDTIDVGVFATDQLVAPPPNLGACPIFDTTQSMSSNRLGAISPMAGDPPFEIVEVHATRNVAAAVRWFQLLDVAAPANPGTIGGKVPVFSFGLPNQGDTIIRRYDEVNPVRFFNGITAAVSSTGDVVTLGAAGDVSWAYYFR